MKKYKVEGNIDFFSELYKSLDENDETKNKDENICLISKSPLTEKFVKLICGHKFNYVPLYNDIVNHKLKFNSMETSQGHLSKTQIRCPYCRKIQNELLPYYNDIPGVNKTEYVNYTREKITDENKNENNCYLPTAKLGKCPYMYKNEAFNPELDETDNNKKIICCNSQTYLYKIVVCSSQEYVYYCNGHMKSQLIENKLFLKEKEKNEKYETKQKLKEANAKAKEALKKSIKEAKVEAKKKLKEDKTNKNVATTTEIEGENVVIDVIDLTMEDSTENVNCCQIIKYGINKGKPCGLKTNCNNLCKRHYNLSIQQVK